MTTSPDALQAQVRALFVALTVVKSMPKGLDLQGYLAHIRASIVSEAEGHHQLPGQLGDISQWQTQLTKAQEVITILERKIEPLEKKIASLEQLNAELSTRPSTAEHGTPTDANSRRKRKNLEPATVLSPNIRHMPSQAPAVIVSLQEKDQIQALLDQVEVLQVSEEVNTYMLHLYALQRIMTQDDLEQKELAACITQLCKDFCKIVDQVASKTCALDSQMRSKKKATAKQKQARDLVQNENKARLNLLLRTVSHLCKACGKLAPPTQPENCHDQTACQVAELFRHLLDTIRDSSSTAVYASARKGAPRRAKTKCKTRIADRTSTTAAEVDVYTKWVCLELSRLVVVVFTSLESNLMHNYGLLEGAAHAVLSKSGQLLHRFTLESPCKIPGNHAEQPSNLEAQSLAWILERVVAVMRQPRSVPDGHDGRTKDDNVQSSPSKGVPFIKQLQSTLLHALFKNDETPFVDLLCPTPGAVTEIPLISDDVTDDARQWYEREVWRILGYDQAHDMLFDS